MSKVTIVYVKGSIRKDAVEITPKECRVTEARVLETVYGAGWVPSRLRALEIGQLPSPAEELGRLQSLYGHEVVEKAYGVDASARQAIAEILGMSATEVKASGLLLENDAVPMEVVADPLPAKSKAA